ncbi:hypothetical protein M501DRAFT_988348 [Patellaria atrata CBS 101060]|uniref:CCHC-type domain-containing protein n=1 Tax=Patellaria atrata CBS 101060 TaxID=1346257 RepID=A0A9P4VVV7_9PEZI|nr:hypothetical protein M501DRAFT_988348 [Patellaria atrata CBS 101060]
MPQRRRNNGVFGGNQNGGNQNGGNGGNRNGGSRNQNGQNNSQQENRSNENNNQQGNRNNQNNNNGRGNRNNNNRGQNSGNGNRGNKWCDTCKRNNHNTNECFRNECPNQNSQNNNSNNTNDNNNSNNSRNSRNQDRSSYCGWCRQKTDHPTKTCHYLAEEAQKKYNETVQRYESVLPCQFCRSPDHSSKDCQLELAGFVFSTIRERIKADLAQNLDAPDVSVGDITMLDEYDPVTAAAMAARAAVPPVQPEPRNQAYCVACHRRGHWIGAPVCQKTQATESSVGQNFKLCSCGFNIPVPHQAVMDPNWSYQCPRCDRFNTFNTVVPAFINSAGGIAVPLQSRPGPVNNVFFLGEGFNQPSLSEFERAKQGGPPFVRDLGRDERPFYGHAMLDDDAWGNAQTFFPGSRLRLSAEAQVIMDNPSAAVNRATQSMEPYCSECGVPGLICDDDGDLVMTGADQACVAGAGKGRIWYYQPGLESEGNWNCLCAKFGYAPAVAYRPAGST